MQLFVFGSCCDQAMFEGEPFCPVCERQRDEHRREKEAAAQSTATFAAGRERLAALARRRVAPAHELTGHGVLERRTLARYPARREVFRLFGIYLPESQAQELLKEVHKFKWITAEKAGEDVWQKQAPENPFAAAAREWAQRYLHAFLEWITHSTREAACRSAHAT